MRCKLTVLGLLAAACLIIASASYPVWGTGCDSGIRKDHLDQTAGAFADGQTIQIDGTVGFKVTSFFRFMLKSRAILSKALCPRCLAKSVKSV